MADDVVTAPETVATAATTETPTTPEWQTHIPSESAQEPFWKEYKTLPDVLKTFAEQKKYIGGAMRLPGRDAKPDEIAKWKETEFPKLQAAGLLPTIPADASKYELKQPELPGLPPINDRLLGTAKSEFHKMGFTQAQAQGALELHAKILQEAVGWADEQNKAAIEGLRAQWGDAVYEQRKVDAEKGAYKLAEWIGMDPGKVRDYLDTTRKGNDPILFQLMAGFGELTAEDSSIGTGNGSGIQPSSVKEKGDAIRLELMKVTAGSPKARQLEADLEALYRGMGR